MDLNSKIIVTGVKGQLGYDCVNELTLRGFKNVKGIDIEDLDITDEKAVIDFFKKEVPEVLIHCAAWTAVDKAEQFSDQVYQVNSLGPKYLSQACKEHGTKMVYISTDYVFNGLGNVPFKTTDIKNGLSIYGNSKSLGEDFIIQNIQNYFIVRISWAFGKNGNNFVKTMLSLAEKGLKEINVVNDQIGSPTYTKDLAVLLCDMIGTEKYGIYHATNEGYCSWCDFAKYIFEKSSIDMKVNGVSTKEYSKLVKNQAKRPLNSRLDKSSLLENGFNLLPSWQDAVDRYLREIKE